MKRAWAMLGGVGLLLAVGCGTQNYDFRIEQTLDKMNYDKRLNDNLMDPVKGKLEELGIYLRPPKSLAGPTQAFMMTTVEPGRFDLESTFIEPDKQSLHVLARVERPKSAAKKAPAQPEAAPRGDFNEEVVDLIRNVSGAEINVSQFKEEKKLNNTFRSKTLDLNAKEMQIYLYGAKSSPYKVALIFEYPKSEKNAVSPKIGLSLEAFAVGDAARHAFTGGAEAEEGAEAEGGDAGGGPPI